MRSSLTLEDEHLRDAFEGQALGQPEPGLVLVFSGGRPAFSVIPLEKGSIEVGRGEIAGVLVDDKRMSRAHARITFDENAWTVRDLGSRNGTFADGQEVPAKVASPVRKVVRTGSSVFLVQADVRRLRAGIARSDEAVMGCAMQRALAGITRAARFGRILHVTGESGTGKELAARAFHNAGPFASGPFVAVNAATLKPELAEVLLFGARKGFYTNAPGGPGYVQAADRGTLFLDEVAELDPAVQAKLLRALETREVMPLGAVRPEQVDFRLCSATHADLRSLVATGKMREDLHYRIATPTVELPPLRDRLEEVPWLIERAAGSAERQGKVVSLHVSFVEACLLRPWLGNVRELMAEVTHAVQEAAEDGGVLLARHLGARAGTAGGPAPQATPGDKPSNDKPSNDKPSNDKPSNDRPSDEAIEEALRAAGNKKAIAARALGMHRTQLYRWLEQRGRGKQGNQGGEDD